MPSSITVSSISAITAAAGLSSISQWTQLTVDQINNMITAVQQQITADGTQIANLTSSINAYDRQINIDPNYQKLFTDADFIYDSTLKEYIRISSLVQSKISTFQYDNTLLSSYSTQAAQYLSNLQAAQRDYSSLLISSGQLVPLITTELSTLQSYQSSFNTLSSYCAQYSGNYSKFLQSTIQVSSVTLAQLKTALSQLQIDYNSLSTALVANPTDTVISTNVQIMKSGIQQTNTLISSNHSYEHDLSFDLYGWL
jgi:DNA repair ATPase RecN